MTEAQNIVLASGNAGKIAEFSALLADQRWQVRPQSDFQVTSVEETGLSFVENAILKARHAAQLSGFPALADDSGLEVDALQGAPGLFSARYAGEPQDSVANCQKLLRELTSVPISQRTARFRCVTVYMRHAQDAMPLICQGTWEGRILEAPRGAGGFGYDPVFWVASEQASAAELSAERKHQLSHRGQAMRQLLADLVLPIG